MASGFTGLNLSKIVLERATGTEVPKTGAAATGGLN